MTEASDPAVMERFLHALSRADIDGVFDTLTEDAVIRMPAAPKGAARELAGREAITMLAGHVTTTWNSVGITSLDIFRIHGSPNRLFAEYDVEGINVDDSIYRNNYVGLAEFNDEGRIVVFTEYFDPDPIVQALNARRRQLGLPTDGDAG